MVTARPFKGVVGGVTDDSDHSSRRFRLLATMSQEPVAGAGVQLRAIVEAQHGPLIRAMQEQGRVEKLAINTRTVQLLDGRSVMLVVGITGWKLETT